MIKLDQGEHEKARGNFACWERPSKCFLVRKVKAIYESKIELVNPNLHGFKKKLNILSVFKK